MSHVGLQIRMLVAGTILFGFYALVAAFLLPFVGLPVVLVGSVLFVGVQYAVGKWLALRSVGATDVPEEQYPDLHATVERLSDEMGITKPRLMVGRMGVPNAFAVGRRGAGVVVISDTLPELLDDDELEGVLAHELAHIRNRDVVTLLLGQSIASIVGLTVFFVVRLVLDDVPIVGFLVAWLLSAATQLLVTVFVLVVSRYREFVADRDAADVTGDPRALATALAKLKQVGEHEEAPDVDAGTAAMCIYGGERGLLAALFSTHPATEKRIERLLDME